jgi:hypothetical protein
VINIHPSIDISAIFQKFNLNFKKSRIRETKNLSTDADSSTDTTVGWTKNTQKNDFFEARKKSSKPQNSKTSRNMPKLAHQCFSSHSLRGVELGYCKWQHKGAEMANAFRYIN